MGDSLNLSFKILAVAVRDASGEIVCYVKQKVFKLKIAVTVFRDPAQTQVLRETKAD